MKIVLAIANSKGRTIAYVLDDGRRYPTDAAIGLAKSGHIEGVEVVKRSGTEYIRSKKSHNAKFNLDEVTVSAMQILYLGTTGPQMMAKPVFQPYWNLYQKSLETKAEKGEVIIAIEGRSFSTDAHVRDALGSIKDIVFEASAQFKIDPYLYGAILTDEIVRFAPFEELTDRIMMGRGRDVSVGIAQVVLSVAKSLVQKGYYNPNPNDEKLSKDVISGTSISYFYKYLIDPKYCIYFGAANIRSMLNVWKLEIGLDLSPEIVASLYSLGKAPHVNPTPNDRGLQIVGEFMPLAKTILDGV